MINEPEITERAASRAGFESREALLQELDTRTGTLYRIAFHVKGPDARIALRQQADLSAEELRALSTRLEWMDRGDPWTLAVLRLISERPGRRAADLASMMGTERLPFKARVRRLKELGLTESLQVGYRLSPRGKAFLERLAIQSADSDNPPSPSAI